TPHLLHVARKTFPPQHHRQAAVAEPAPLRRKFAQLLAQRRVRLPREAVAHKATHGAKQTAGPPLAHFARFLHVRHRFAPLPRRHPFFVFTSFRISMSSIVSARSFFSFAFSSSSAFSFRSSAKSIPPNFDFHL